MKRIAIPAITGTAMLLLTTLVAPPLNVDANDIVGELSLILICEVDKTITVIVFYFTDDGIPIAATFGVLECDKVNFSDISGLIGIPSGANDFHKNIKVFRNDRLVWACHDEIDFEGLQELEEQITFNECRYKHNFVDVFGTVFVPP
jgi:hypothetical protein